MSSNPYKAPESITVETIDEKKVQLSQASGRKKNIIGIPASSICGILAYIGIAPGITRIFGKKKWDSLMELKKFIISTE